MKRPTGVTVIAAFESVSTASGSLLIVGGSLYSFIKDRAGASILVAFLLTLIPVVLLSIFTAAGYALWKLENWGRAWTIVFASLVIAWNVWRIVARTWPSQDDMIIGLLTPSTDHFSLYTTADLSWIVASIWAIWYLLRPDVKRLFGIGGDAGSRF